MERSHVYKSLHFMHCPDTDGPGFWFNLAPPCDATIFACAFANHTHSRLTNHMVVIQRRETI
jgi:hypothetical protein